MSNISEWSVTAGSNNSSPPNGWPEGMARSAVNDTARECMAAIAKWYKDLAGSQLSAGTSTAYTLTTNNVHAALNDINQVSFRVHTASGASATLNVDGLGAKSLFYNGAAIEANTLAANAIACVQYNPSQDRFELLSSHVVGANSIASGAITTAKYAAGSVDATALGTNAVTTAKINALAVTTAKIAADAVTATEIAAGAVGSTELATNAVASGNIQAGAVIAGKLGTDSVTATEIAAGAVAASELATDAVTTIKILDSNVTAGKLASDSVTTVKILADNVTYAKIQNVSATDRLLGRDTAGAGDIEELTLTAPLAFTGSSGVHISVATDTLLGRDTAGTGAVESLSVSAPLVFTGSGGIDVSSGTTSAEGVLELATAAEMETGTDSTRVPSVSVVHNHPGVAKAWGCVTYSAGVPTLQTSYNISGITDDGVGGLTVSIATNFSSVNYAIIVTCRDTTDNRFATVTDQTVGDFAVSVVDDTGGSEDADGFYFACFGDQ